MLICMVGLPSVGKSSTAKALSTLIGAQCFLEPEEEHWPQLVRDRHIVGRFTALTWFRSARVPHLFAARDLCSRGGLAIVDSYYDKLLWLYLQQDSFAWLVPKSDPYFDVTLAMAKLDFDRLPTADVLVFLRISQSDWRRFVSERGRSFDADAGILNHFEMQDSFESACSRVQDAHGTRVVVIDQVWSTPMETARRVHSAIGL